MQEHGAADADRGTADRGDQRLVEREHGVEEAQAGRARRERRPAEEVLHVVAGAEAIGRALQQHHSNLRIGLRAGERVGEAGVHVLRQRIFLVGARQLDERDAVCDPIFDQGGNP